MSILMTLSLYVVFVIGPVLFWYWFFRWQDRDEPEPRKLLIKTFFWGVLSSILIVGGGAVIITVFGSYEPVVAFFAAPETYGVSFMLVLSMFSAGPIEEGVKYLILRQAVYTKPAFNQIADGVFYGVAIGLGFSFIENTTYFASFAEVGSTAYLATTAGMRALASTLVHVTATGLVGYALALKKFGIWKSSLSVYGVVALMALYHGLYNVALTVHELGVLVSFPLVFIIFMYTVHVFRKPESRIVWKKIRE